MSKKSFPGGLRPGDAAVIAAVLAAAVLLLLPYMAETAPRMLTVTTEAGSVSYPLPQTAEYTVSGAGYTLILSINGSAVCVRASDCPGGDCMRTGVISRAGQSIVCMPARAVITLAGEEAADDADWILP